MLEFSELLEGCHRKDRDSQRELYERYNALVYGASLKYTFTVEEAEDLSQDIFIKLFDKIKSFYGDSYGALGGWIKRLAVNHCIDYGRKVGLKFTDGSTLTYKAEVEEVDVVDNYDLNDMLLAIRNLSPRYQEVFNLYVLDGYTHNDISKQLGVSPGTSKANLHKAKENVRRYLRDGRSKSV